MDSTAPKRKLEGSDGGGGGFSTSSSSSSSPSSSSSSASRSSSAVPLERSNSALFSAKKKKVEKENKEEDDEIEVVDVTQLSWKRPALPTIAPSRDNIAIQQLEADYTVAIARGFGSSQRSAIIRCFGVSEQGNSVVMYIHGFQPYFYVPAWQGIQNSDLKAFGDKLNEKLKEEGREKGLDSYVLKVEPATKQSIWGYHFGEKVQFLKVVVAIPALVAASRRILEQGIHINNILRSFSSYESNTPFVLRWMVDWDVSGGSWIEVPNTKYRIRQEAQKETTCQLEVDVRYEDVISHKPEGKWLRNAPVRILSFDIECAGRKGIFPQPEIDPVIQIASVLTLSDSMTKPIYKALHTLNTCAPILGAAVISSDREDEMLMKWRGFVVECDPDIITGYNIINFDLPYLLDRATALKLDKFNYLGRLTGVESKMKNTTFHSKAIGKQENKEINIDGRIQFDVLAILRRDYKLRSYTLNAVSAEFLKQQKEDVHHSIITDLQNGTDETRKRLGEYCLKDALLPIRLVHKLMLFINHIEMARVTGVPINFLLTRGQSIKVLSCVYRKSLQHNLVVPVIPKTVSEDKYEGATVLEPKTGFYTPPIATLDFASLYPSIMMAHNLCYTTMVSPQDVKKLRDDAYIKTPTGDFFVKQSVQKGILPEILIELLAARKAAKKDMAKATDPFEKAVYNGRQLALKITANSVYGFTGAQVGQLPCLAISSSVTAFGRMMIDHTKATVEKTYTIANGYSHDAEVVYGDTDSVMVRFGTDDIKEAMRLGLEAAKIVTKEFTAPISLEFEKVYWPFLLMNKKRYAGLYWTNPDKWDKIDTKGIETVRRDNCGLVKNLVTECLDLILVQRSPERAVEVVKKNISDLLCNRMDLSLLVISKSLGKSSNAEDYANKQAHVELAERMRKRDPASAPAVGDRVPYVIIKAAKNAPAYEKSEDPVWVLENDIPIDTDYYLENQLKQPLTRLFEPILGDVKHLFAGDHTLKIVKTSSAVGGIMKFAKKTETCIGCKVVLQGAEKTMCKHCRSNEAEILVTQVNKVRTHEETYAKLWSQCQRCQGSLHQDVLCTSRDCPIFYRRKKVQKDLGEAQNALDRFSLAF